MLLNTPLLMKETPWKVLWQITLERAGRTWPVSAPRQRKVAETGGDKSKSLGRGVLMKLRTI